MELQTTLNNAPVTIEYTVEFDEVDCYADGREYTDTVMTVIIDAITFKGNDVRDIVSDDDLTSLEMECTAAYGVQE